MKTYISGQITGLHIDAATEYFQAIEDKLTEIGYTPINPMKVLPYDPKHTWHDYMIEDIRALFGCEAIFMLDNWQQSKGARIEHAIAEQMGINIFYPSQHNLF